jgi:pimeloyl-ACP methyl ester carboxylesterase
MGHEVIAPAWPGLDKEPAALRSDPSPLHGLSITDIVDSYETLIRGLGRPPIIIGHSFGGLITQLLLDRGLGSAAVALGTATPKGVFPLPLSSLRAGWPALKNPFGKNNIVPLSRDQFYWCFTNALSRADSDAVYDRYYIPGSARPFFQAAYPGGATKVRFDNPQRPPLLLVTGTEDRICPASLNVKNWKKQSHAPSVTEHKEYPGRCHYPGQDGWEEVADFVLEWTVAHSNQPSGTLA